MFNCCTLSDYNYLLKGLVLYDSLEKYTKEDFILYYLCLDDKTFDILNELNLEKIRPVSLKELEYNSPDLQRIKQQISYKEYCFTLSSYFTWYLLKTKNIESCLYVDSDIIFYDSLKRVFDTVKDKSIGIITHRHIKDLNHYVGYFNVGIVFFKNNIKGMESLTFWKNLMLDPSNEYSKEYGTCGDQRYLVLLYKMFEKHVKIIDEDIHYSAPYNFPLYSYEDFKLENKQIGWKGKKDNIVFCHFIKFKIIDFDNNKFQATETIQEEQELFKIPQIKELYNEYFQLNKECLKKYLTN